MLYSWTRVKQWWTLDLVNGWKCILRAYPKPDPNLVVRTCRVPLAQFKSDWRKHSKTRRVCLRLKWIDQQLFTIDIGCWFRFGYTVLKFRQNVLFFLSCFRCSRCVFFFFKQNVFLYLCKLLPVKFSENASSQIGSGMMLIKVMINRFNCTGYWFTHWMNACR